jgi:hypothetical protein
VRLRPALGAALAGAALLSGLPRVAAQTAPTAPTTAPASPSPAVAAPTTAAPPTTGAPQVPPVTVRTPTEDDPLRVLLFGDSVMGTAHPGIDGALQATGVGRAVNAAAELFGLVALYDWRGEWPAIFERERPDVIVLMFGGWDADFIRVVGPAYYQQVLDEAVAMITATGALVVFIGSPTTGAIFGAETPRRFVNGFFQDAAQRHPGAVLYLAPEPVLDGPLENYRAFAPGPDGQWRRIHKKDDVHLCAPGAALLAEALLTALRDHGVALPALPPGWDQGPWADDPVYSTRPPEGCEGAVMAAAR